MLRLSRVLPLYPVLGILGACAQAFSYVQVCNSSIYCSGEILRRVQLAKFYNDSKTFVDKKLLHPEADTLADFAKLLNDTNQNPSEEQLWNFVESHFEEGNELENWIPPDFDPEPPMLKQISDPTLRQFAKNVISIWSILGRKVKLDVAKNPGLYSFLYVPNGFIIPGGRFRELYYWDSFWIVRGLLISNMTETARGMIENLLYLVDKYGYIPNGSRIYYLGRSQPPLLTAMVASYYQSTQDFVWLRRYLPTVEKELKYWLENKKVTVEVKGKKYYLLRYIADQKTHGPRPEAYNVDFKNAQKLPSEDMYEAFYLELKSSAESGWDFSTRWYVTAKGKTNGSIIDVHTSQILPVDLNSIFAGALDLAGDLRSELKDKREARKWWSLAKYWRRAIKDVLWDEKDGVWYDYDLQANASRKTFYPSCATPLWAGAVDKKDVLVYGARLAQYLTASGALEYRGGIPTSLQTGQQWDFPNAWAPLESILIGGLEMSGDKNALKLAKYHAKLWINANYIGYKNYTKMFEKYNVTEPGQSGTGGEYTAQAGFGWTNGVALELLLKYGKDMALKDKKLSPVHSPQAPPYVRLIV